ncbi:MAG: amidohydrolase family protein [Nocardioidaceae bacterium]
MPTCGRWTIKCRERSQSPSGKIKIIAIGSNADTKFLIGKNTRIIDAKGKLILPGFNDSHVHFLDGGTGLSSADLRDAKTPQEFVERIKNFATKLPKA